MTGSNYRDLFVALRARLALIISSSPALAPDASFIHHPVTHHQSILRAPLGSILVLILRTCYGCRANRPADRLKATAHVPTARVAAALLGAWR